MKEQIILTFGAVILLAVIIAVRAIIEISDLRKEIKGKRAVYLLPKPNEHEPKEETDKTC